MDNMDNCIAEVPFKSNGKSVRFFNDHLEFKGQSIPYDEIATLAASGSTTVHTYVGIPIGRGFTGGIQMKMNNGKSHNINLNSMSIFGIPCIKNPRKCEKLFPPLFDAIYSIVVKSMAQNYIDKINRGNTVEVAGLTINSAKAVAKSSKKEIIINQENYRDCQLTKGYSVAVYNKPGDLLWSPSIWSNKNILLIPYILDSIFG